MTDEIKLESDGAPKKAVGRPRGSFKFTIQPPPEAPLEEVLAWQLNWYLRKRTHLTPGQQAAIRYALILLGKVKSTLGETRELEETAEITEVKPAEVPALPPVVERDPNAPDPFNEELS